MSLLEKAVLAWCALVLGIAFTSMAHADEEAPQQILQMTQVMADSGVSGMFYVMGYLAIGLIVLGIVRLILVWRG